MLENKQMFYRHRFTMHFATSYINQICKTYAIFQVQGTPQLRCILIKFMFITNTKHAGTQIVAQKSLNEGRQFQR